MPGLQTSHQAHDLAADKLLITSHCQLVPSQATPVRASFIHSFFLSFIHSFILSCFLSFVYTQQVADAMTALPFMRMAGPQSHGLTSTLPVQECCGRRHASMPLWERHRSMSSLLTSRMLTWTGVPIPLLPPGASGSRARSAAALSTSASMPRTAPTRRAISESVRRIRSPDAVTCRHAEKSESPGWNRGLSENDGCGVHPCPRVMAVACTQGGGSVCRVEGVLLLLGSRSPHGDREVGQQQCPVIIVGHHLTMTSASDNLGCAWRDRCTYSRRCMCVQPFVHCHRSELPPPVPQPAPPPAWPRSPGRLRCHSTRLPHPDRHSHSHRPRKSR